MTEANFPRLLLLDNQRRGKLASATLYLELSLISADLQYFQNYLASRRIY